MNEKVPDAVISQPKMITPAEVMGLVDLMTRLLKDTEDRIVTSFTEKLDDNADGAKERWQAHETEHQREHAEFLTLKNAVETHHHAAEKAAERIDARLSPLRNTARVIRLYWPQIVLAAGLIIALLGWFDATHHILVTP